MNATEAVGPVTQGLQVTMMNTDHPEERTMRVTIHLTTTNHIHLTEVAMATNMVKGGWSEWERGVMEKMD